MLLVNKNTKDVNMSSKGYVWLQGIGWTKGKVASEIVVGDKLAWNGGYTSTVLKKLKETKCRITFEISGSDPYYDKGKTYERIFDKNRIVAISYKEEK